MKLFNPLHLRPAALLALLVLLAPTASAQDTFSMVAFDPETGEIGSAGATCVSIAPLQSFISAIVPGRGAIHTQGSVSTVNKDYAQRLMEAGASPAEILDSLLNNDSRSSPQTRQFLILDVVDGGRGVGFSGDSCFDYKGHIVGQNYVIAGNILIGHQILASMEERFLSANGSLADRLMAALQGAKTVGADARCDQYGTSSLAAFVRVAKPDDPVNSPSLDLHVVVNAFFGTTEPIDTLQQVYVAWKKGQSDVGESGDAVRAAEVTASQTSSGATTFEVHNIDPRRLPLTLRLYNSSGVPVGDGKLDGEQPETTFTIELPSGVYLYQLVRDGMVITQGKVVVQH